MIEPEYIECLLEEILDAGIDSDTVAIIVDGNEPEYVYTLTGHDGPYVRLALYTYAHMPMGYWWAGDIITTPELGIDVTLAQCAQTLARQADANALVCANLGPYAAWIAAALHDRARARSETMQA